MEAPSDIQLIGDFLAIRWVDGREDVWSGEFLRQHSPSAENMGEVDILGKRWGGDGPRLFPGVQLVAFQKVGNYAVTLEFSDGHKTGIYSWSYLRALRADAK